MAATRVKLRVSPDASRTAVVGRHGDGRANDAIVRLLADTLKLSRRDVAIVAGHTARNKVAAVTGIDSDETISDPPQRRRWKTSLRRKDHQ